MQNPWTGGLGFVWLVMVLLVLTSEAAPVSREPGLPGTREHAAAVWSLGTADRAARRQLALEVQLVQAAERAAEIQPANNPAVAADEPGPRWRRTAWGWERAEWWQSPHPGLAPPVFHPGLFALLQVMLSLMGLIAWPEG